MSIKKLVPGDEAALERFLCGHVETSMFLRSNLRNSGLIYEDQAFHGDYFASLNSAGEIEAVLAQYWNGNVMIQTADVGLLGSLTKAFCEAISRPIAGFLGLSAHVESVVSHLGLAGQPVGLDCDEKLYSLDLEKLVVPVTPDGHRVEASAIDRELLGRWIEGYEVETGLIPSREEERAQHIAERGESLASKGLCWGLVVGGEPVALCGFNSALPDIVQIGPVWTPPNRRGKGYARLLVALCLEAAREKGVRKAILFTDNPSAAAAYQAIGFEPTGAYRLYFLKDAAEPSDLVMG